MSAPGKAGIDKLDNPAGIKVNHQFSIKLCM